MKRKILFLINPVSGTRSKALLEKKIIKRCLENTIAFELLFTTEDGDYSFLKNKIKKDKITDIVICGGDGTLSPVISSLSNTKINIGIIPMGSGNGLAFTAKIPHSVDKAFDIILDGKTNYIDTFLINGKLSCMLCGIGLDAQVAYDFAMQKKRGLSTYIKQTFKNFLYATPYNFEIKIKDSKFKVEAFFISIANSNQFGNNFTIAPKANLSDGLLDIIVVKKMSKPLIIWSVLRQMKAGKIKSHEAKDFHSNDILYFQTDRLQILNPQKAPLHIDGDHTATDTKFNIEVIPAAFNLIVP